MHFNNALHPKLTNDEDYNELLTLFGNTINVLTPIQLRFLVRCKRINDIQQRPFSFRDFSELSSGNFRQRIHKLKEFIEPEVKGRPTFYKIKGIKLPGDTHRITKDPTGLGHKMFALLTELSLQPPMIHNLKLQFETDLHEKLIASGCSQHHQNHSILMSDLPSLDNNVTAKLLVYPKKAQLDIGCTYKPFVYDVSGILHLVFYLGMIYDHISSLLRETFSVPPVNKWIVTHYHFNKDGSLEVNGQDFHFAFEEVTQGLIRFYSKRFPDGTKKTRLEKTVTPKCNLIAEIKKAIEI